MSELLDKRIIFTAAVARLIEFINGQDGYSVALGPDGLKHKKNSLHYEGLAVDLNIYKDGKYLTGTDDYAFAGHFWKAIGEGFSWGGDFKAPDGNHFSLAYGGRR